MPDCEQIHESQGEDMSFYFSSSIMPQSNRKENITIDGSITLSHCLVLEQPCVDSSYRLREWTGQAVNITFLFHHKRWVYRQKICICLSTMIFLASQLLEGGVGNWELSRPSCHLHQQLPTLAISLEKMRAASILPQTAVEGAEAQLLQKAGS